MTSPFNGTWKLDKTRSKEWDWKNSRWIPDQLEDEVLTIFIDGNIYDWDLKVNIDPEIRLTHSSIIDGDWTPYMCRSITVKDAKKIHPPKPDVGNPLNMVKFGVGQPTAMVKLVKVNDNIIYRVSRT